MPDLVMLQMANGVDKNLEPIKVSNREILTAAIGLQNSIDKRYVNDLQIDNTPPPPAVNINFKGTDNDDTIIIEHDDGDDDEPIDPDDDSDYIDGDQ